MNARVVIEAESPKKALKAATKRLPRWRETEHGSGHMAQEGWDFEIWYYQRSVAPSGAETFYLEKVNENPADPNFFYWRVGVKARGADRWKVSGSLSTAEGEVERGLPFGQALQRAIKWAEANLKKASMPESVAPMAEAEKEPNTPKKPTGESPKSFFQKGHIHRMAGGQAAQDILQYMPDEFRRAFAAGKSAEWENPHAGEYDWWPSYDDDNDDEDDPTSNPWTEYVYYWDYRTEGHKLYGVLMSGDRDGNHDAQDEAEVGTPEYERMEKEYGSEEWQKAMNRYYQWVVEHRRDPLGYANAPMQGLE